MIVALRSRRCKTIFTMCQRKLEIPLLQRSRNVPSTGHRDPGYKRKKEARTTDVQSQRGMPMSSSERVIAALGHERPDRIPRYEILLDNFVEKWRNTRSGNHRPSDTKVDHDDLTQDIYKAHRVDITKRSRPVAPSVPFSHTDVEVVELEDSRFSYRRDGWGRREMVSGD